MGCPTLVGRCSTAPTREVVPLSPDADTHAPTRARPHKIQADTLRHLACLIDRTLDDSHPACGNVPRDKVGSGGDCARGVAMLLDQPGSRS